MILKWGEGGVLASRGASANFLGRSSWYQIYGLFMGSSDMQPTATPKLPQKLLTPQNIQKVKFFFQQQIAL